MLHPPPMHAPSILATLGTGNSAMAQRDRTTSSWNEAEAVPSDRLTSPRSAPAQNAPPLPFTTSTPISGLPDATARCARMASHISHETALRFSGRRNSSTATPPFTSNPTNSDNTSSVIEPAKSPPSPACRCSPSSTAPPVRGKRRSHRALHLKEHANLSRSVHLTDRVDHIEEHYRFIGDQVNSPSAMTVRFYGAQTKLRR